MHNSYFQLDLDTQRAAWSLRNHPSPEAHIQQAGLRILYRRGLQRRYLLEQWPDAQVSQSSQTQEPHGSGQQLLLTLPAQEGLVCQASFFLPDQHPMLLWRLRLENHSSQPVWLERLELLRLKTSAGQLFGLGPADPAFWANGWQSWSYSAAYGVGERQRHSRLGPFNAPMVYNAGTPQPSGRPGHFSSDLVGILGDRRSRRGWLLGFLSQQQQFGSLETQLQPDDLSLRLWANGDNAQLDPGQALETDWACLHSLNIDDPEAWNPYLQAAARANGLPGGSRFASTRRPPDSGWCSWYHFYQNVSAENVANNLAAIQSLRAELPLQLVQIDDGFEAQIGDWFQFSPRFPDGPAPLAARIRQAGFEPGIWLAPFIVHPKSRLAAEHPDWLLRNRWGLPVNAGFVWNAFNWALDLTQPEALAYACSSLGTAVKEWGFSFLKLDFLYAAALPGRYRDPYKTRAQVLRQGLAALRLAAGPDTILLGCGCPLGSALGLVDAMRIGADTDPAWLPHFGNLARPFEPEPHMPSMRNSLQNALSRAPLHRQWWINDPDCLLLRQSTGLTQDEVQFAATVIALTGGLLLLSDDLPALSPERRRLAQQLLPLLPGPAQVLDWFDQVNPARLRLDLSGPSGDWSLVACLNWQEQAQTISWNPADYHLPAGLTYLGRDFWSGELIALDSQARLHLPAHGALLLAVRTVKAGAAAYLGSDIHLSQGMEVQSWQAGETGLQFELQHPGQNQGQIILKLPKPPQQISLASAGAAPGQPVVWQALAVPATYQLQISFYEKAELNIAF